MARIAIDSEFEAFASETYTVTRGAGTINAKSFKTFLQVSIATAGGLDALGFRNRDAIAYATGKRELVTGDEFEDGPIRYVVWEGHQTGGTTSAWNIRRVPPFQTFTMRVETPGARDPITKELSPAAPVTSSVLVYAVPQRESFTRDNTETSLRGSGVVISRGILPRSAILEHPVIGSSRVVQARPFGPWWSASLEVLK